MAMHETQPDTLPTRLVTAFTSAWEESVNSLLQCQFGRGVTTNFAEYYIEPLKLMFGVYAP